MTGWVLLLDVLFLLTAAMVLGAICERLRQSAIVGSLLAGMLLGPHALHLVGDRAEMEVLAELGVALLLFSIGLEFSWRRLGALGPATLLSGVFQVLITMLLAAAAATGLGVGGKAALAIGAMITLSSTAVVLRMLVNRAELDSVHGRSALAILLVQDIAVVPLVLLVGMLGGEGTAGQTTLQALKTIGVAAGLVVAFILLFNHLVPRLLGARFINRNRELPILLAIVTALGSAWAAHEANLSPALGAFVAGMLLAGSPFAVQIRADISGLRTLLVTLFFAAVGMYANPAWIIGHLPAVLGLVAAIVLGKALIMWVLLRLMRRSHASAAATGVCLAQVGEFSFVLAGLARGGSVISDQTFLLFVSGTIITLVMTPYLVAAAPALGSAAQRIFGRTVTPMPSEEAAPTGGPSPPAVLIIGFGPAGRIAAEALRGAPVRVRVLDLNPRIAAAARECGCLGHVGDATHPDVLSHAQVAAADVVAVTLPDPAAARRVIRQVRAEAPEAYLIARARYHVSAEELRQAGADVVVDEEEEVGRRIGDALAGIVNRPPHGNDGGAADRGT